MYTKNEKIILRDIEQEMRVSYTAYAMSVIISRALPDARDGLKPSQRRILIAMNDLNLAPNRPHRKCAKIAGDTSGNYHPHGEQVIYPTLVRMAQDFSLRYMLADGQGNFGSVDGDPPAAMRYTEARLSPLAMRLLDDLDQDTVDFVPNYDETRKEPTILPGKFPNLLCNGSSGIAVGMATNIPPHNLCEVVEAIKLLLDKPEATVEDLMKVIHGPDFPTGGIVYGMDEVVRAYKTGRGRIKLRGRAGVEPLKGARESIIISEIPYIVGKAQLIEKIADLVQNKKIGGISDIRDESDKDGMRIVIELKRGENAQVVLNQLYKQTPMQTTFGIILLALDHSQPRLMNLKEFITCYIEHRKEVIYRRTAYQLAKAEARAHILEGFKVALANIDIVVKIIKAAKDRAHAKNKLMARLALSAIQADAILDMRLYQLTGLEKEKINKEYRELIKRIAYLKDILDSEKKILGIIKKECDELAEKYGDERRTELVGTAEDLTIEDLIADESCLITVSHHGYIKRVPSTTYRRQRRGGKGVAGMETREEDFVEHLFMASTHDYILFFTDRGKVYWLKVYEIPQAGRAAKGRAIINLVQIGKDEKIAAMIRVKEFDGNRNVILATEKGIIKKTKLSQFSNPRRAGIIAMNVDKGDSLIVAKVSSGKDDALMVTRSGKSIRFSESQVRPMGRSTRGVKGITLGKNDRVVILEIVNDRATLFIATENGYGKRTEYGQYRKQSRGGKGIIAIKTTKKNGLVVGALSIRESEEVMMITEMGKMVRASVSEVRIIGRATQGVRIITLSDKKDKLVSIAIAAGESSEEE
ncbi:MAG: DNA gyrase subunit A [Candidatus Tritonobacter lacicola]|nr:DNA gyrase subunit A [Candidatus Tritonobacter lacicola]